MSSYFSQIRAALEGTLNGLGVPVAWENVAYTPALGTQFIRPTILPAETAAAGLGINGQDRYQGYLQLDVFEQVGVGLYTTTPDDIADAFKRGSVHTYSGVNVRIRSASIDTARRETSGAVSSPQNDPWFIVPILIRYYAYTGERS